MIGRGSSYDLIAAIGALALLCAVPFLFAKPALRDFLVYVMAYGLFAMSLNLLIGLTGLVSFGHAAFFASGAYIFGLLMKTGQVSVPVGFLGAVAGTAALALVIGAICVRLKELYFSFITLALQMFVHSIILTWVSLTGGDQGLQGGIPRPVFLGIDLADGRSLYVFCAVIFVACILIMRQIWQSPLGFSLRMIRDNPARANFLGVNVLMMKLGVFVIAGAFAGIGGVLLALFVSGAYPEFGFWTTSGEAIFMIMLGGSQFFLGPVLGAFLLRLIEHFVTVYTEYHGLVLGAVILFIVLGLRQGVGDFIASWLEQRRDAAKPASEAAVPDAERTA